MAAIEVPLLNETEHAVLVHIFRRHAATTADLHVDDGSEKWRAFERQSSLPEADRLTFNVGIWRGKDDDEAEVLADDRYHPGRVWITFQRGSDPARSTRFREPLIADLLKRWPNAQAIPILEAGNLPLASDLVLTNRGYRVKASAAQRYDLSASSRLIAN
ncbi:MAG TPA: hypothetical protein VIO38_01390 [Rariglobus sp.]